MKVDVKFCCGEMMSALGIEDIRFYPRSYNGIRLELRLRNHDENIQFCPYCGREVKTTFHKNTERDDKVK